MGKACSGCKVLGTFPTATRQSAMKIGALAEATGTPVETIRFYEREGLLPPPARADNNYRMYLPEHAERLVFIRQCRNLDMTLDEIRVLLRLKNVPTQDCSEVNRVLEAHIEQVAVRIQELSALEQQLRSLREMCSEGRSAEQCGILCELSQPVSAAELAVP